MKSLILLVVVLAFSLAGCGSGSSVSQDVVARVNDKEITSAELEKQFQSRIAGAPQPPTPEEAEALRFDLLTQMIDDEILLQLAASSNPPLTATDAEVETKFTELRSQYTEERFQEMLKQQKVQPEDIKHDMRRSLTIDKLVSKEITSRINVTEKEIQDVFEKNRERFNLPETYRLQHIMVTPFPDPQINNTKRDDAKTPAEALAKAQRIYRQILGGLDFAVVAREESEDVESAPNGGELGFRALEDVEKTDPKLAQHVRNLKVGETSPLIETRYGYHIFKLLQRDPGGQKDLNSAQVQAQIRQAIFSQKEQVLRAAFAAVARNKTEVHNYLAERLLESAGKVLPGTTNPEEKKDAGKEPEGAKEPEKKEEPAKK